MKIALIKKKTQNPNYHQENSSQHQEEDREIGSAEKKNKI
jgi:hypothetical protein